MRTGEGHGGELDVSRYETLRERALHGEAEGWRLGLAVLAHRGVAAWLHAWHAAVPAAPAPTRPGPSPPPVAAGEPVDADELVGVLAGMALAAAGR